MKYSSELTGNIIKNEREKHTLSQRALGNLIGVTGKQISNYEKGTPMPPIDVLLKLCKIFNCELGYLLGEELYSNGTSLRTAIINKTGLSSDSIQNIQHVTGENKNCLSFGRRSDHYRKILNDFLSSEHFLTLVENLSFLADRVSVPEKYWSELENKYGKEVLNKALEYLQSSTDYLHDTNAEKLPDIYYLAMADIDHTKGQLLDNEYSIKVARYELNESFSTLIESIYPKK